MNLSTQKRLAASILKCGVSRVRIKQDKAVEEALTREDIRGLIERDLIWKIQKKGTARGKARKILSQKRKGRKRGPGSKKGIQVDRKREWMSHIRAQRRILKSLRDSGNISKKDYRTVYLRAKGGMFRSKKHMLSYLKERDILKEEK